MLVLQLLRFLSRLRKPLGQGPPSAAGRACSSELVKVLCQGPGHVSKSIFRLYDSPAFGRSSRGGVYNWLLMRILLQMDLVEASWPWCGAH